MKNMKLVILQIINDILILPPHEEIIFSKDDIPHPLNMGFREDLGEPLGQIADYRLALRDGRSIHARDYGFEIGFHWDKIDPIFDGFEHLRKDSPLLYTTLCFLGGAGLGALAAAPSKKKDVLLRASAIGGLIGLIGGLITAEWE